MTATPIIDWSPNAKIHPTVAVRRFAAHIIDEHGREWIDLLSGFNKGSDLAPMDLVWAIEQNLRCSPS